MNEHPGAEGRESTAPPWLASQRSSDEDPQKGSEPANPEEVPADEIGAGENICRGCQGTGQIDSEPCADCGGSGKVTTPIGGG
jgi:RecJ-like exonuclease